MAPPRSIRARPPRRDAASYALFLEACLCLAVARVAIGCLSFPRLARRLGAFTEPEEARARAVPAPAREAQLASQIGWAVRAAARRLPFRALCLPQALAARIMLARRGIASVLHFGVATGDARPIAAHAWIDAAGVEVAGYPAAAFTEIACFV